MYILLSTYLHFTSRRYLLYRIPIDTYEYQRRGISPFLIITQDKRVKELRAKTVPRSKVEQQRNEDGRWKDLIGVS